MSPAPAASSFGLIPTPVSLELGEGFFSFDAGTVLVADEASLHAAALLADAIRPATCFMPRITPSIPCNANAVVFALDPTLADLGAEGYHLKITPAQIILAAPTQAGLFYAIQTLRQLLPSEIYSTEPVKGIEWRLPCVSIRDWPRFAWRGLMLDTGHDFQRLSYIFRFIDLMAMHKFNVFHWHICDHGIFPLEIHGYPELQNPAHLGKRLRGFPLRPVKVGTYSHEEARAVVAYAAARHITVMPEIDIPGHSTPVLNAYPEFDCPAQHTQGEFGRWEYCLANEKAISFIETMYSQVAAIFPSKFFHVGGDECPTQHWEKCPLCRARIKAESLDGVKGLRQQFWRRIERFLIAHGRRMIGWDEIFEDGVERSTAIMPWRPKLSLAAPAAAAGHDLVMAQSSHLYFNCSETKLPLERVYGFEPVLRELAPEQADRVLGAQAQFWTNDHPTEPEIDRFVYPRACAVAEVVWSEPEKRDWKNFHERLELHARRLFRVGIDAHQALVSSGFVGQDM